MYRSIVRRQYRKAWEAMNRHDYEAIIAQLAPTFEVTFVGDTSLGGSRHTKDAMRRWFERLFRLFPDARFELRALAVDGWPWDTRIFGSFGIRATVLGETHDNVFIHFVKMRWGQITSYSIYEDSLKFWRTARVMAAHGFAEATAPAVLDEGQPTAGPIKGLDTSGSTAR
jgi:ketosteroid isomerase-like protein